MLVEQKKGLQAKKTEEIDARSQILYNIQRPNFKYTGNTIESVEEKSPYQTCFRE